MKALEILKAIEEQEGAHLWLDDGSGYPKKYIIEAIKELEELENRSCENCKYDWCGCSVQDSILIVDNDAKFDLFCCNKWEAKK